MKNILSVKNLFILSIALIAIAVMVSIVLFKDTGKENVDDPILAATTPKVTLNIPKITDNSGDKGKATNVPDKEPDDEEKEPDGTDNENNDEDNKPGVMPTEAIVEETEVNEEIKEKSPIVTPKEDVVIDGSKENNTVPEEEKEPIIEKNETSNTIPEVKEEDKPVYGQDNTDPAENPFGKGGTIIDESPAEDYVDPDEGGLGEGVSF